MKTPDSKQFEPQSDATDTSVVQAINLHPIAESNPTGKKLLDGGLSIVSGVKVKVEVVIGSAAMTIGELFALNAGSVISLDQLKDEPLAIRLDGKTIAMGRLVAVDDRFGVCISEILPSATAHAG